MLDQNSDEICFRNPRTRDGIRVWEIAKASRTLDLNSVYHYLIMCRHFRGTSLVAEARSQGGDAVVGFVTAYVPPETPETVFVWQVAVDAAARGRGIAREMLVRVFENAAKSGIRYLAATITPSNAASIRLFTAAARELGAPFVFEEEFFAAADFGPNVHEPERLFRIGPCPWPPGGRG